MTQGINATSNSPLWMDVIKLSKRDIETIYEPEKMKKRASRNYFLGCSIGPTIDYNSSTEFAKALLAILIEAEAIGEGGERDKAKMVSFVVLGRDRELMYHACRRISSSHQ